MNWGALGVMIAVLLLNRIRKKGYYPSFLFLDHLHLACFNHFFEQAKILPVRFTFLEL